MRPGKGEGKGRPSTQGSFRKRVSPIVGQFERRAGTAGGGRDSSTSSNGNDSYSSYNDGERGNAVRVQEMGECAYEDDETEVEEYNNSPASHYSNYELSPRRGF